MTYTQHLIWRYRLIAERLGADEMRQVFTGAKASLLGGSSLSPELRSELLKGYEEAEKVLFPDKRSERLEIAPAQGLR